LDPVFNADGSMDDTATYDTLTINTFNPTGQGGVINLSNTDLMADSSAPQGILLDTLSGSLTAGTITFGNVDNNDDDGDGDNTNDSPLPIPIVGDFLSEISVSTSPIVIDGNVVWNYVDGQQIGSSISGSGNVAFAGPSSGVPDVSIGVDGDGTTADLILPTATGFSGHMIIGGTLTPFEDAMSLLDPLIHVVLINAENLTVNSPIILGSSPANLTLLATSNLNLNNDINIGTGQITLASIDPLGLGNEGNINALSPVVITASSGYFVATGDFTGTTDITLAFNNGFAEGAIGGSTIPGPFGPSSNVSSPDEQTPEFINVVNTLGALAGGIDINSFNTIAFDVFNATAQLIALEELGFIDTGLFEQDLTLFGIIGYGIALALAQCEEIEGCAPDVTMEELDSLIAQLEARIEELEKRCAGGDAASCDLLDRYKEELEKFKGYREQLEEYLTVPEEELDEEFEDEFGEEVPETNIQTLTRMLESVQARVRWLESLRTDPEARERLGNAVGIELTLEVLEEIIDGAKLEADFIEKQIQLMQEGTQAFDTPVFTAEARDYNSIQYFEYGPSILTIASQHTENEWVY
jgi:hypothetical protein